MSKSSWLYAPGFIVTLEMSNKELLLLAVMKEVTSTKGQGIFKSTNEFIYNIKQIQHCSWVDTFTTELLPLLDDV